MTRRTSTCRGQAAALLIAGSVFACAGVPEPPAPIPALEAAPVVTFDYREPLPALPVLRRLPPRVFWAPPSPAEGTLVIVTVEPEPAGLPLLEVRARNGERELPLAPLRGGAYLALIAAPRSVEAVPVELDAILSDGTRLEERLSLLVAAREFSSTRLRVAPRYTAPDEAILRRVAKEREWVRAALRTRTGAPLWSGSFDRPLDGVSTSPYGQRRMFNNEVRSQHTGLDIDGDTGDPVKAANRGRVLLSRDLFFNGQAVFIDHGLGFITGYFHLSKREVVEGQWVEKGEVIGRVGATGRVTGPHLHWSAYVGGVSIDPLSVLGSDLEMASRRALPPPGGLVPEL